ncbi:NAD-dependent epimerase/dehydratase family protein [Kozakia baliensis]|uniref:NAD-dependent epimerase/dehydratase family protein n=1 Tax=Kozakia baliensis TaxID=153496 RepID=UPI00087BFC8D|nr:NAD(P)-dependent oxidoreductase [Kozakia baliensis]AOX20079.1 3-beta hydroxysteroid dehydrogenase [Kozakia baliensis]
MKILVTGGTGFLGSRLFPKLVQAGHEVFALTRSPGSHRALRASGALPVDADLDSATPLALPTTDAVVHAAALFRFSVPREPCFPANVDGTVALLGAAEKAGARCFIFMSAAGVVMDESGHPTNGIDESARTFPNHFSAYLASKAQAEALVLAADKPVLRMIALRLPAIWGPQDPFSRELSRAIKSGQFAFIDRGEYAFSTCHVDNVIEAIGLALESGVGGRALFIADREQTTFREFIASLATLQGLSVDKLHSLPYWLVAVIGRVMDSGSRLMRRKGDPPISRSMMRMIGREFSINDNAARRVLGYVGRTSRADGLRGYEGCEAS